jgi:hypothetical protein
MVDRPNSTSRQNRLQSVIAEYLPARRRWRAVFENGRNSSAQTPLLGIDLSNQFVYARDDGVTANDANGLRFEFGVGDGIPGH